MISALACCGLAFSDVALAELPSGERKIMLQSATGSVEVGRVNFGGAGERRSIAVRLDEKLFKNHFLSMRPFKCLEGKVRYYCHLPYPYAWNAAVTVTDLADLEYALLFVQKEPSAYGINLWRGVYYKMQLESDGRIIGVLNEVDMDILASPPPTGELRPLRAEHLAPAEAEGQWLPRLLIE